jgi:hypothetical protein
VRIVAALVAAAAVLVTTGAAAKSPPVLGFSWGNKTLTWFDPATLKQVSRKAAPIAYHTCAWDFSSDGSRVASSLCGGGSAAELDVRIVDTRALRSLGDVQLGTLGYTQGLAWLRPDRVVNVVGRDSGGAIAVVVDPQTRRVVRRVALGGDAWWFARLADRVAFLLVPAHGIGAVQVATVDSDGTVRRAPIPSITAGSIVDDSARDGPSITQRGAGFAVDSTTRTGYVVGANLLVARVDLDTLAFSYHSVGATRAMQKVLNGPQRSATWLPNGLLAITGVDYASTVKDGKLSMTTTPFGLHLLDPRDWTMRRVDSTTTWVRTAGEVLLAQGDDASTVAYDAEGRLRWRTTIPRASWLEAYGAYGYVCDNGYLRRVLDLRTGATTATLPHASNRRCAALLTR